ncbi:FAD-binding oxidoreductase [Shewanella intestini]|uniref:2Fe-2S iron-sulfur cluster binding domain-containing protein n=1 Tax=Shewanella intestini TaxID=2017544 RepID=A0ABS5HZ10_9GAMM|nr:MULTISPECIES: FAD-binding oxidoreductase [Shewanella]MBR9727035.1 2Fe-2S iron-sulfur cluster binding domain-containing protein [Shewanella intestini]MRG35836.1 2Fe-2S iron-sulfur cluster binding domain-containing protein [Shewanella sp. XMDDZSB0408]
MPNIVKQPHVTNVLHAVDGYDKALTEQQALYKNGTDFTEQKGWVANTVAKLHPKRIQLIVSEVIHETPSTVTLRLISQTQTLPPFQAGQYINLFVSIAGTHTARPYAISSQPQIRGHYDLTIKRVADGFVSNHLIDHVQVGDKFESTGPMGTFYHNPLFHGDDLVFIAGGSGIAPARAMINDLAENTLVNRRKNQKMHLIYSSSYESDVIFEQEVRQLEQQHDFLTVSWIITRPNDDYQGRTGRLTAETLMQLLDADTTALQGKMFYVCGPTAFHDHCQTLLTQLKVKARRVRIECNGPPKAPHTHAGWPKNVKPTDIIKVTIQGQGSFDARVDEPLLNSMERHGYRAENACRSGECSLCRVKVVSGSVFNPAEAKLRSTDEAYRWCHSCVAFPTSDIKIII